MATTTSVSSQPLNATISSGSPTAGTAPISLQGLGSGLNDQQLITELVSIASQPITNLQTQESKLSVVQSAYTQLGTSLTALQSAAQTLSDPTTFDAVAATSSNASALTATSTTGALKATYNVTILNRSTASRVISGAAIGGGAAVDPTLLLDGSKGATGLSTALTSPTGSLVINGVEIGYDATTDSLNSVITKINNSSAGVNAMYDKLADKVILTNRNNGSSPITVTDFGSGNLGAALNLTATAPTAGVATTGKDAQIVVDGINNNNPIKSSDDLFTDAETGITGLSISLQADTGTSQVNVGTDVAAISANVNTFVTAYNAVQEFIKSQSAITSNGQALNPASPSTTITSTTAGPLEGSIGVEELASKLRSMVSSVSSSLPAGFNYLDGVGVGTTGVSPDLSLDSAKLTAALTQNPNAVKTLFSDPVNGIMEGLTTYVQQQASLPTGLIQSQSSSITDQITTINRNISNKQATIAIYQQQLVTQFSNMEAAVSGYKGGISSLLSQLGQSSGG